MYLVMISTIHQSALVLRHGGIECPIQSGQMEHIFHRFPGWYFNVFFILFLYGKDS